VARLLPSKRKEIILSRDFPGLPNSIARRPFIIGKVMTTSLAAKKNEESPYKPETTLLCVRLRSKNTIALIIAPK
jgi:hypothetical protein